MAQHEIENEYLKVTVDDHGAELVSVFDKGSGLERIWCADPAAWNRHSPILFPFVGKVIGGVYRYEGKEYEMKTQHGFARDAEFECVSVTKDSITHCLCSNDAMKAIYPFDFRLLVTHRFVPGSERMLEVVWEVQNPGEKEMFFSIGGHPGFTTPAGASETRDQYFLEFPGKESLEYILVSPESGFAVPWVSYPLALDQGYLPIANDLFDRDALIFENGQLSIVRIAKPDRSPYVTMECDGFPSLGIWSKPEGRFVCLEPWLGRVDDDGFTGELKDKAGEQRLAAGESRTYSYRMEFHPC